MNGCPEYPGWMLMQRTRSTSSPRGGNDVVRLGLGVEGDADAQLELTRLLITAGRSSQAS